MKTLTKWFAAAFLAALTTAPAAHAASSVVVLGAGSSAMWQTAAIGAFLDLAGAGAKHYTVKGKTTAGNNFAQLHDVRSSSIPVEGGNLWVVWSADKSKIWAYLSVDSVVGNRAFFASPRAQLQLDSSITSTPGQNLISSALLSGTPDSTTGLDATVYAALNNAKVTAGFTDIRPEDAKFAQVRAASALDTATLNGLGYGTGAGTLISAPIQSAFSTAKATPVAFNLSGTDPFNSANKVPAYTTISVGAAPIVFVINRQNAAGLGKPGVFKNIDTTHVIKLFNGTECDSNAFGATNPPANVPVTVVQREPLSGTMNTTEFTNFRLGGPTKVNSTNSQEANVGQPNAAPNNPLSKTCLAGGGSRKRAIGTGELVSSGILATPDSIGYLFFSYGNVSKISNSASWGYLTLNGVDPIVSSYSTGNLPPCTAPCPATPGSSFPHLRDGTYRSWSVLRVVTDNANPNLSNTQALVTAIQNHVNGTVPDFVPFLAVGGDPGLTKYRSHYPQSGVPASNGLKFGTTGPESGGDVGGCIEPVTTGNGVLNCHQ